MSRKSNWMQAPATPKSEKMIFITFQPKNAKTESNRKNEPKNEIYFY